MNAIRSSWLPVVGGVLVSLSGCGASAPEPPAAAAPTPMPLSYAESFEAVAAIERWVFTDSNAWRWRDGAMELFGASEYQPPVRSPRNIALLSDVQVGDFTLEARLQQTGREYGHRDLCLFFGFEGPSKFYYVHLASVADDHAHNVFVVNDAPRTKLTMPTTSGVQWGTAEWHRVRVERTLADGRIAVFFDDELVMEATDHTFGWGFVGFGSFDDTGMIDDVVLSAPDSRPARMRF